MEVSVQFQLILYGSIPNLLKAIILLVNSLYLSEISISNVI
ncbi:hypothetical protein LD85_2720 [Saccharolobus islandicus L.D.8.5]|uniref:Uncharacterized protein n=1 Tax=Saccharolobus islandicus (strain L.D.8.5 / Lassen \|nr:hypothetical protein LD85_2720 [Sulfolobus islandicus L.D.8.5]